jgi:hypothetical protein
VAGGVGRLADCVGSELTRAANVNASKRV